ncbi:cysteine ABC transporter substrate-binding protein [Helicobacter cappadocius]|uniref:Cysteine ABC transporter substrate-binding protein n=1 Tax=Helicobacter cappadocius TaxID=3063998 RepID=A0AA90PTG0_9HELI|nr:MULTISPECIES: cysteine ABC transporter substrate-binding protein [unclassified Helicobacter]MDO7252568.1 cysteine ABC transporter substrate-binding protein [Helicobacter sp. faydin-H75]MDP2538435.1 cysteine ABC transporter substrate-binding protein [Helicobacter sp. faydin-H76]
MKNLKKFFVIGFIGLLSIFVVACSDTKDQDGISSIKKRDVLRVGVFSDKPPFGFINAQGQYDGFDVYISKKIAKDMLGDESKIEFIPVEAMSRVEFIKSGKVDIIMANFTKTKEREEVVDFAMPYMKVALGVVSKNGEIKSIDDLKDKPLIVNKGTTADFYFSKNYPDIKLLKYDQNTEAFQALKDGRADALAHDNTLLFAWAKENPGFVVSISSLGDEQVIAPAVKKGNKELLEWLNNEIKTLNEDGFIKQAYDATLAPIYGTEVDPASVIFEEDTKN